MAFADHDLLVGCSIVDLEVGYSARNRTGHDQVMATSNQLPRAEITQSICDRALQIQSTLASKRQHRIPIPDLLIAAVALENDLTVLHYDSDFDIIASATGLHAQWIAPRGSL
jgi:predicted nucleic acid-binding protein